MVNVEIKTTNLLLQQNGGDPLFLFLTGASGAGKTHLAQALQHCLDANKAHVAYFDNIGVPPLEQMISEFGSGEKWQEAKTHEWIQKLAAMREKKLLLLEGQFNPVFARDGLIRAGINNYILVVAHCEDVIRESRLKDLRKQPELVNQEMRNWAKFLHAKTIELGGTALDTGSNSLAFSIDSLAKKINAKLSS